MKVLLLGAGGQLARHLAPSFPDHLALTRQQLDLTDPARVREILESYRPQVVINAAAYTAVDLAEDHQELAFAVNAEGPGNLAIECQRMGLCLVHFSTDYVFPGQGSESWGETDLCKPLNQYGASKYAGEELVRRGCEQQLIVRLSWLFGSYGQNFVKTILRLAETREQLTVVRDQRGCPTWCGHLPAVLAGLLDQREWGTYHYCDGPATNWWEFACTIVEQARKRGWNLKAREILPIATADYPTRALRPACSILDCGKLKLLGITQGDWLEGLDRTLQEIQANRP